jgi:Domain of unknown function (DUF4169)
MGELVNLRKVRKARARAEKSDKAAENRARFGRTKAEKACDNAETTLVARTLDGAMQHPSDDKPNKSGDKG